MSEDVTLFGSIKSPDGITIVFKADRKSFEPVILNRRNQAIFDLPDQRLHQRLRHDRSLIEE
jgi:hypothetical protein